MRVEYVPLVKNAQRIGRNLPTFCNTSLEVPTKMNCTPDLSLHKFMKTLISREAACVAKW